MVSAYALIVFLQTTELMNIIAKVLNPVMGIFGFPSEVTLVIIAAFFAKAAGLMLYQNGIITKEQATILYPAVILIGTLIEHYARIILVSGVLKKYYKILLFIPLIDAAVAIFITKIILGIFRKMKVKKISYFNIHTGSICWKEYR